MLRFFFCLLIVAPVFFLPDWFGSQDAEATVESPENTYSHFTETKISELESCHAESIPVYFSGEYVETHSAAFLHDAVDAASNCGDATARVVKLKFDHMNDDERALASEQAQEVNEFLDIYDAGLDVERTSRDAELDTRAVNGRAVVVEFEFD